MSEILNHTSGNKRIDNIISKIEDLTAKKMQSSTDDEILKILSRIPDPVERVKADLRYRHIYGYRLVSVPSSYYSMPLSERAKMLRCHVGQLCKSIVMENTSFVESDCNDDIINSKYFCIVLQYCAKLDEDKLNAVLQRIILHRNKTSKKQISMKKYHFRLVASSVNDELTGFSHNAVSPYGINHSVGRKIPIICSKECTMTDNFVQEKSDNGYMSPCTYMYLGGGDVDVKLGISVHDFIASTKCVVGDISNPRDAKDVDEE